MGKVQDATLTSLMFAETADASIATPAADKKNLFVDDDGLFKFKDESGAVTDLGRPTAASQAEMEAGTEAALRSVSPLRVAQAIAALGGGGGGSDWDATVTKASDQTVTNSATLTNDTELTFATTAGTYLVEGVHLISGNDATGDFRWRYSLPTLVIAAGAHGFYHAVSGSLASANPTGTIGTTGTPSFWPNAEQASGTDALHSVIPLTVRFVFTSAGAGTVVFMFANWAAAAGRESTTKAGSILRYKKLA